jgi:hypothetical protein
MGYGNGTNGADHDTPKLAAGVEIATGGNGHNGHKSPEHLQKIRELLSEAFDPAEIKWRVTATSTYQGKHGPQKRGRLVAYADQRAYTDRLNTASGRTPVSAKSGRTTKTQQRARRRRLSSALVQASVSVDIRKAFFRRSCHVARSTGRKIEFRGKDSRRGYAIPAGDTGIG